METTAAPPILVHTDLHCIGCQYNLRTRPADGICPECARPIRDSLTHHARYAGAILEPATLRLAAYCFGIPSLLAIAVYLGTYLFRIFEHAGGGGGGAAGDLTPVDLLIEYIGHILFVASLIMGVVLLGGSVSGIIANPGQRVLLAILAAAYGAINVLLSLGALATLFFGRVAPLRAWVAMTALREQRAGTALLCLIMSLAGLGIMRKLAAALASPRLLALTRLAFGALILCAAGTLATLILGGALIPRRNLGQFDKLFNVLDLVSAVIYLAFGIYWLIVARTVKERTKSAAEVIVNPASTAAPAEQKIQEFLAHRRGDGDGSK